MIGVRKLNPHMHGAGCGIEPVVSFCELLELKISPKRDVSPLQLAAPNPINETATSRHQWADRRNSDMAYSLARNKHATE